MREDGSKARRLEIRITGRVQGVCFRMETRRAARDLGIMGFVRNMPDGSVFVTAEGREEDLWKLLAFCRKGPPGAGVDDAEFAWKDATGCFDDFEITR